MISVKNLLKEKWFFDICGCGEYGIFCKHYGYEYVETVTEFEGYDDEFDTPEDLIYQRGAAMSHAPEMLNLLVRAYSLLKNNPDHKSKR